MFFGYALAEAMEMMTSVWAKPTAGPVLAVVGLVSAGALLLSAAGMI
jgi:hypothetical protein